VHFDPGPPCSARTGCGRSGNRTSLAVLGTLDAEHDAHPPLRSHIRPVAEDVHNHMISATLGVCQPKRITTAGRRSVRSPPRCCRAHHPRRRAPSSSRVICEVFGFARPEILDPWPYELVLVSPDGPRVRTNQTWGRRRRASALRTRSRRHHRRASVVGERGAPAPRGDALGAAGGAPWARVSD